MTKPYAHIVGQRDGEDLHAFDVQTEFTRTTLERLGRAVVLHDLRVTAAYTRTTHPRATVMLSATVPASKVEAAKTELGPRTEWRPPIRVSVGMERPAPTWGELRDQVEALLRDHRGPMLPCGHPVALLVFDGADGAIYRCPGCVRDIAELAAASPKAAP